MSLLCAMPKPTPWPGHDLSKALEAEQQRILDLARAQHDAFEQSLQLSLLGSKSSALSWHPCIDTLRFSKILQLKELKVGQSADPGRMVKPNEPEYSPPQPVPPRLEVTLDDSVDVVQAPNVEKFDATFSLEKALQAPASPGSTATLVRSPKTKATNAEDIPCGCLALALSRNTQIVCVAFIFNSAVCNLIPAGICYSTMR